MASITITRTSECTSLNHVHLEVTGDAQYSYDGTMDDIMSPISDSEKDIFIKVLLRIAKIGRTTAQVRNALTNGYTVTI